MKNGDPSDLLRVTAALAKGFDDLRGVNNVLMYATCNLPEMIDEAIITRSDHVIHFALPTFGEARLAVLRQAVTGLAGERVLPQLAAATDGWSGRELSKITYKAYVFGTVDQREELTEEDFLRAVGLMPEPVTSVEEERYEAGDEGTMEREDVGCTSISNNGYQEAAFPRRIKLIRPWRWFE